MKTSAEVPSTGAIFGGLNTSKKSLERLADAVREAGFVTENAELQTFTLGEAAHKQGSDAVWAAAGGLAVAHSMGNLIWERVLCAYDIHDYPGHDNRILPSGAISLNRIMPSSPGKLVWGGVKRFGHHLARTLGEDGAGHRAIIADTFESVRDPKGNIGRIKEAVPFSSDEHLGKLAELGVPIVAVISETDEFAPYRQKGSAHGVRYVEDEIGCHDAALYRAADTLQLISDQQILPQLPA